MNIISLPDEMLASIFKYINYATITRVRKTNTRCNAISNGYGIGNRLPVKVLSCEFKDRKWTFTVLPKDAIDIAHKTDKWEPDSGFRIKCVDYRMPKTLDNILKKVSIMENFSLTISVWSIDDSFLERLTKNMHTFKYTKSCRFTASFGCSLQPLKYFIEHMAKLDDITICGTRVDRICQPEIFRNRKWNSINIHSGWYLIPFKHEQLNDQFLLEVVQNCRNFRITCEYEEALQFTIQGIMEVFKNVLELGQEPNWVFEHVQLGYLTMFDAETMFCEIPNCSAEFNQTTDASGRFRCRECKVSTNDSGSLILTVSIYDPNG